MGSLKYSIVVALAVACSPAPTGRPSALVATEVLDMSVALSWKDTANDETGFSIERSEVSQTTGFNQVGSVVAGVTTYRDQSAQPATTYWYKIAAIFGDGGKTYSDPVRVTTQKRIVAPVAATALAARPFSVSEIELTWVDNSTNETAFELERGALQAGPFSKIATLAADVITYTDAALTKDTTYFYRLRAANSAGASAYTPTVSGKTYITNDSLPPSVPSGVVAMASSPSSVTVSWQASTDSESGVAIYRITQNTIAVGTVPSAQLSYTAGLLASNAMYCFQVVAEDVVGNRSAASTPSACASTPSALNVPTAPTDADAGAITNNSVTVTWTDNSSNEVGFRFERATAAAGPFTQVLKPDGGAPVTAADATQYQSNGLTAATQYFFRVRAVGSDGGTSNAAECTARTLP